MREEKRFMIDVEAALKLLMAGQVEFIVIGGVAASTLGSARATFDLDIVYARAPDNIARLVATL